MPKKLTITITLLILATLTFAQTTGRGLILETITEPETTLGQPEIKFQTGHSARVSSVSFSPNGKYIASVSWDDTVRLWDVKTGKEIRTIDATFTSFFVNFTPDGENIIGVGASGVFLYEVETGEVKKKFNHDFCYTASFSPDGKYIASGGGVEDNTVKLWEVESGKEIRTLTGHTDDVFSVHFSPDGKCLASGSWDNTVKLWEVESGKEIRTLTGHTDYVYSVSFSPDGKYIASGSGDNTVKLWEVKTGKEIKTLTGHKSGVNSVNFSPDGKYLASGSNDNTVKLWEVDSGKEIRTLTGHTGDVSSVNFSPDGKYLASGSDDSTVKLWDVKTGKEIWSAFAFTDVVLSVSFSPDGKCLASGSFDNTVKLWEVESGKEIRTLTGHKSGVNSVNFSPDGKYLASGSWDDTVKLWEVDSGKEIRTFSGHTDYVYSVSFSPDGKYLASGSNDNTVKIWEVKTGKEIRTLTGHTGIVNSVNFSLDGKYVISGSFDDTVKLWNVESGEAISTFSDYTDNVIFVSFTPNGKYIVIVTEDGKVRLRDVENRELKKTFYVIYRSTQSESLSPNGKYIAIRSRIWNKTIDLWKVDSGKKRILTGHTGDVNSVNFSPDSKYIASGSSDGTVKLWNVETGELIYTIINGKDGEWLTYTPEGFFTGSEWATKNLVHIVDGLEVIGIDQVYDKLYRPDLVAAKMRGEDISMYAKEVNLASLVRSGSVPVVTLENLPENPTSRDITFDVCVKNTGGGIGKVNLVLNGKTIQLSEGIESSTGQTVNFRHTITLQNGENTIEAFAYNGSGMVESRRSSNAIKWEGATSKPNLYVLTLAINKYRDKSLWLNYCVPDANAIVESFKTQESGLYENVYVSSLQDGEVTKDGISEEFKRLSNLVTADDVFVFYISGHGTTYDDGDYYYLPVNFRYTSKEEIPIQGISKNDLIENLSLIKAGKTLLMLDTCHSGAFFADSGQRGLSEKTAIDRLTRATGHATLAASSDSQSAMEGYEGHGVFTYVLLEGLKGEADSNDDGFVTLLELASYVENEVPERSYEKWGYEQVPQKDLRRQDFPIAGM